MKIRYILLFFLFCYLPSNGQFHVKQMISENGELKIPFEYEQGFIIVKVFLEGVLPLDFIFDTGAENTVLFEREYADLLGITYNSKVNIIGSDRKTTTVGYISRQVDLAFLRGNHFALDIIVLEENKIDFKNIIGRNIEGLIGGNMLFGAIVEIDYKKQIMTLRSAENWTPPKNYHTEDLTIVRQRPYLKSTILVDPDKPETKINLLLDTGAAIHVMIDEDSHPSLIMPDSIADGRIGQGLGGSVGGFLGNISSISLFDVEMKNTPIYFQQADSILYEANHVMNLRNGLVGNLFLNRYKVIIDYPREKLYTKARKKRVKPFRFNKSGLTIYAVGPYLDEYVIKYVVPNSSADRAGLKVGDVIKNVNGIPTSLMSIGNINYFLSKSEGKEINMKVSRHGGMMKTKMILRTNYIAKELIED